MSELLWIAVPGGTVTDGEAVLRVLIVPRLTAERAGTLADHGMGNWPETLALAPTLLVELSPGEEADVPVTQVLASRQDHARPDVWKAFFGPATAVSPFIQRQADEPTVEPTSQNASKVISTYEPSAVAEAKAVAAQNSSDLASDLVRHKALSAWSDDSAPAQGTSPPRPSESRSGDYDFHRTVAILREHPSVLRALGLIVELTLPASALSVTQGGSPHLVRVRWPDVPGPAIVSSILSPWTRYEFDGRQFLPAPQEGSIISSGMVDLTNVGLSGMDNDAGWELVSFDVHGAAARLRDAAQHLGSPPTHKEDASITLPTLRSAGLTLLRRNRQEDFTRRRRAAAANAGLLSTDGAQLTADDLVLGYRVDVHDGTQWFSLCEREAKYKLGGIPLSEEGQSEEGHVKAHSAVQEETDRTLRADEAVVSWTGWSLVVPRPTFEGNSPTPAPTGKPPPFDFRFSFAIKTGSLPMLRFGRIYKMRLRVADVAGGGLRVDDPGADRCDTQSVRYLRYEPVLPPRVEIRTPPGPGGTVDQLVIRSDRDQTVARFSELNPRYQPLDSRDLLPPPASAELAEQHNRLNGDDERTLELIKRAVTPPGLADPAAKGVTVYLQPEPAVRELGTKSQAWGGEWPDRVPKHLELAEPQGGAGRLTLADDKILVSLAQAEQMTLDVSSFIDGEVLHHFAISHWLRSLSESSDAAASEGRHSMVTPARVVHLVHAVRRPLSDPGGSFGRFAVRSEGNTFADLVPEPLDLNVHAASTAQLDISAEWLEWGDSPTPTPVSAVHVQSLKISPGDRSLPFVRHEFGDTKHRTVRYTLTAVSRFRQFFDENEDEEAFRARTTLPDEVSVLSSARPPAPVVVSTAPAFGWSVAEVPENWEFFEKRRLGGKVRVELARPWYVTGEGEKLAVVVSATGQEPSSEMFPYLTQAGRDPRWDRPVLDQWPTEKAIGGDHGVPRTELLLETNKKAVVIPYDVWFDDGRWYADVDLQDLARSSYCPFVQLAVARFQRESEAGLALSPVVRTEMVQLVPDRTLTIRRKADEVIVELEGVGPPPRFGTLARDNEVQVRLERFQGPPAMADAVDVTSLQLDPPTPAWTRPFPTIGFGKLNTTVHLPLPPGDGPLRVFIREIEYGPADTEAPALHDLEPEGVTQRTVFVDAVTLPVGPPDA